VHTNPLRLFDRPLLLLPSAVIAIAAALPGLQRPDLVYTDDAFIFLRFSRHIVGGLGAVWNPGEPPVEGFTSFLFQMLLAGFEGLGWTSVARGAWIGIFCALATLAGVWLLARGTGSGGVGASLAVLLMALTPILPVWAVSGLDTTLYTALLVFAVLSYVMYVGGRVRSWAPGVLFGLAILTRPEAIAVFGLTLSLDVLRRRADRTGYACPAQIALGAAVLLLPFLAWRWVYFGHLLPNTYYAKTGAGLIQIAGGWRYLTFSLDALFSPLLLAGATVLVAVGTGGRKPLGSDHFYLAAVTLTVLGSAVLTGGDHFLDGRFILPALPFMLVLASAGVARVLRAKVHPIWRAGALLIVAALVVKWSVDLTRNTWREVSQLQDPARQTPPPADATHLATYDHWQTGFTVMGQTLREIAQPEQSIAALPIGRIGYYSDMHVIDMAGIVDPVIARQPFDPQYIATWRPGHDKGDGAYLLSRQPDLIQLVDRLTSQPLPEPDGHARQYKSIVEIWDSPKFHEEYEYYPVQVAGGWYYNLYRRVAR
jgi:arabinofuranosyltransferase